MGRSIRGRRGTYELRFWQESGSRWGQGPHTPGSALEPLRLTDPSQAVAFARAFASEPAAMAAVRAFLAGEIPDLHRADDAEVIAALAARLASGRVIASRVPPPTLLARNDGPVEDAPPASEPAPALVAKTWIEIELDDMAGNPIPGFRYRITLADGSLREGVLDARGRAREDGLDPGTCEVTFPTLDTDAWEAAR